jgi:hypothetical protein
MALELSLISSVLKHTQAIELIGGLSTLENPVSDARVPVPGLFRHGLESLALTDPLSVFFCGRATLFLSHLHKLHDVKGP